MGVNGFSTNFSDQKEVLRFCEEGDCSVVKNNQYSTDTFEKHRLGGELKTALSETPTNGERTNIVGILKLSSDMITDNLNDKMKYNTLIDSVNQIDHFHQSLKEKYSDKILQNFPISSFNVGDDVKVCYLKDQKISELDGTLLK